MSKKKVAIIFTGGTISMKIDSRLSAAVPSLSGQEIISLVTNIDKLADIEIHNFTSLQSPAITPSMMLELSKKTTEFLSREDIDGVVITHGTDTLEETAFFLDLNIKSKKPIVFVGAMRNGSELGYDGPSNLSAAISVVVNNKSKNRGVLVVMNDEINSAVEVTKTHTLRLSTFKSLQFGPLGIVDQHKVIFYRVPTKKTQHIPTDKIENNVELVKVTTGMRSEIIDYLVNGLKVKGLVLEAFGRGNVPPNLVDSIKSAIDKGVKVVLVSRCPMGRVLDTYGYIGGGKSLRDAGVIFAGNLNGQKARIKLMLALAYNNDYKYIKNIFERNEY